jgi:cell division protease FtsH
MIPAHRRWLRKIRTFVILLLVAWGVTALIASQFPVAVDQTSLPHTLSPAETTRNFFTVLGGLLKGSLPQLFGFAAIMFIGMSQIVGMMWIVSRGRTYTLFPGEYQQSFNDVRGQPEIVASIKQVMSLFTGHKDFRDRLGGYPPKGLLFEGPPGTGKTLLAKAIAGESGVPFMFASGAGFAGMFIGTGNLRLHRMFSKARKHAQKWGGCVIFLDELDAIGGARSGVANARQFGGVGAMVNQFVVPGGGGQGDSALVNELLTQMDGIDAPKRWVRLVRRTFHRPPGRGQSHNILVVGATNRAQTLDPALVRPGRFDRKIHVGLPGEEGRRDIIAFYLAMVAHVPIDIDRLAKATVGYSPAQIRMLINEGLIFAERDGRDALAYDDIAKAKLHNDVGLADPVVYHPDEKRATAIHEAGHAVSAQFLDPTWPVDVVSVRKRGNTLGMVKYQLGEGQFSMQKDRMLARIQISLAGMVSEEIWLGQSSDGPSGDLKAASLIAIAMVGQFGMGKQLISHGLLDGHSYTDDSATLALRDPELRGEVDQILQNCKTAVRAFLEDHRQAMELIRDTLVEQDEISGDEFRKLLYDKGLIPKPKATMIPLPILAPGTEVA